MKISVIITTYNRPDALHAVLIGLCHQTPTNHDWEIIIADDGSTTETAHLIKKFSSTHNIKIKHIWHKDKGFRAAQIRNLAAINSSGDYLIFLDGDCIPLPDFISQHSKLAEKKWTVAGNRILMSEHFTNQYISRKTPPAHSWGKTSWIYFRIKRSINNALGWLRLDIKNWRKKRPNNWKILRSCNVGIWRTDFDNINGFDSSFSGWGYEDSDLAVRLIRNGTHIKNGRFSVPVLHLWHKENDRSFSEENWKKFETTLFSNHIHAKYGITNIHTEEQP
ncbi:glycosyltransferase family 2 protein [Laribacter hongkongensis]|uniref:glycosyltransferase family 2 protein n=1 Tax=Laribacter hongkongensis TaxID=168471 RepID=UPI000B599D8B|nr:glycosyltransferase family 2 protein [Laribacter hongkongensis]MCG9040019.1 glycosyltransferase family 2 protein [Laribacter hongkongensis]MCG9068306.1 glycosyltransferase family 2 protein [Laribacter hongkongensis]MCG9109643.1 glycosyltransferase family 2 protein [Laribacter hongkongensis]MCG9121425.1 glycosyltransferase family 2 protein [Laribacter hongkongensis]